MSKRQNKSLLADKACISELQAHNQRLTEQRLILRKKQFGSSSEKISHAVLFRLSETAKEEGLAPYRYLV